MLTDEQVYNVIRTITRDLKFLTKGSILTNSFRVLASLSELKFDPTTAYLVTSGKSRELATDLYTAGAHVYIAALDKFAKEFRRQFEFMIFDLDGLSCEVLDLLSETIIHGAKDGCIICLMSSCNIIGDEAIQKVEQIKKDIAEVFGSDDDESYARRLHLYMNSVFLPLAATPWYSSSQKEKVGSRFKGLIDRPGSLMSPIEDGETPFLGTKNYATLSFMIKHTATACVRTHSFPIPAGIFFVDDEKQSTGVAYAAMIYRGSNAIDQRRYQSKCSEMIADHPPFLYRVVNNSSPERKDVIKVKAEIVTEKTLFSGPVVSSIGRKPDVLLLEQRWYEKLKTTLETCAAPERVTQIIDEVKAWVAEHGGKETTSSADLQAKFSEYPELSEFVSLIGDMTGDKKS